MEQAQTETAWVASALRSMTVSAPPSSRHAHLAAFSRVALSPPVGVHTHNATKKGEKIAKSFKYKNLNPTICNSN